MHDVYVVLLAGGSGERLWPLSRSDHPKQFLSLVGDQTMFEDTLDRVECLGNTINIWCISSEKLRRKIEYLGKNRVQRFLYEEAARNTGPAVLYSCLKIQQEQPSALALFLPTDHYIPDKIGCATTFQELINHARITQIMSLLGITPHYPATGYGYIAYDPASGQTRVKRVMSFFEKPSLEQAQRFIAAGYMLWNAGIFCAPVQTFIEAFKETVPELYNAMLDVIGGARSYTSLANISFDCAVLEKWPDLAVIPADFIWSDVGDIATFLTLKNRKRKKIISLNANDNLVYSHKKVVALAGVSNLCIVETDDALLIVPKDKAQEVKNVLALIKQEIRLRKFL